MHDVTVGILPLLHFQVQPELQFLRFDSLHRPIARLNDQHDRRGRRRIVHEVQPAADGQIERWGRRCVALVHWNWAKKSSKRLV